MQMTEGKRGHMHELSSQIEQLFNAAGHWGDLGTVQEAVPGAGGALATVPQQTLAHSLQQMQQIAVMMAGAPAPQAPRPGVGAGQQLSTAKALSAAAPRSKGAGGRARVQGAGGGGVAEVDGGKKGIAPCEQNFPDGEYHPFLNVGRSDHRAVFILQAVVDMCQRARQDLDSGQPPVLRDVFLSLLPSRPVTREEAVDEADMQGAAGGLAASVLRLAKPSQLYARGLRSLFFAELLVCMRVGAFVLFKSTIPHVGGVGRAAFDLFGIMERNRVFESSTFDTDMFRDEACECTCDRTRGEHADDCVLTVCHPDKRGLPTPCPLPSQDPSYLTHASPLLGVEASEDMRDLAEGAVKHWVCNNQSKLVVHKDYIMQGGAAMLAGGMRGALRALQRVSGSAYAGGQLHPDRVTKNVQVLKAAMADDQWQGVYGQHVHGIVQFDRKFYQDALHRYPLLVKLVSGPEPDLGAEGAVQDASGSADGSNVPPPSVAVEGPRHFAPMGLPMPLGNPFADHLSMVHLLLPLSGEMEPKLRLWRGACAMSSVALANCA